MRFFKEVEKGLVICLVGSVFCMQRVDRQLPIDAQLSDGWWHRVTFTSSPSLDDALKCAKLNEEKALSVKGDDYVYHLDAACVYYLYILAQKENEEFYGFAKKALLSLLKKYTPSPYLINICCFILGSDPEFRKLYEEEYNIESITCCSIS